REAVEGTGWWRMPLGFGRPRSHRHPVGPPVAGLLQGLDLNQRPLGYEGNGGCDGRQARPTGPKGNWRLQGGWLFPVGAGWCAFTDNSRTGAVDERSPRGHSRASPGWALPGPLSAFDGPFGVS